MTLVLVTCNARGQKSQNKWYPNMTWRNMLYDYLFTTELYRLYFRNIFLITRICYISNGRGFTKKPLRILLSTFRVSRFVRYRLYLARFLCYWRRKTSTTLKSGLHMGQGHWRLHHWIPHVLFPIIQTLYPRPYRVPFMRYSLRQVPNRSIYYHSSV